MTSRRLQEEKNPVGGATGVRYTRRSVDGDFTHRDLLSSVSQTPMLIAFHKPYGVLSQFTTDGSPNRPLAEFGFPKNVYPIGRLDADSEGLLLLSDEPEWNARLLEPRHAHEREYWVQVERIPSAESLQQLASGLIIQGRKTLPCHARLPDPQPIVPPRDPPIRFRKSVPDCWIILELVEGKNRQVRRMTAAVGHPTLRLLRNRIGELTLGELSAGEWKILSAEERRLVAGERRQKSPQGRRSPTGEK